MLQLKIPASCSTINDECKKSTKDMHKIFLSKNNRHLERERWGFPTAAAAQKLRVASHSCSSHFRTMLCCVVLCCVVLCCDGGKKKSRVLDPNQGQGPSYICPALTVCVATPPFNLPTYLDQRVNGIAKPRLGGCILTLSVTRTT